MALKKISQFLLLALGFIVLSGLFCLSYIYPLTLGKTSILYSDYGKFYHSQQMLIQGKNIYTPIYFIHNKKHPEPGHSILAAQGTQPKQAIRLAGNLNPPFFTLVSFPLAYLSYPHALLVWTFLSIIAGYFSILLIQQKLEPSSIRSLSTCLLLLIGFSIFFPSFANLQFGQVSLLLLPLLVFGWRNAHDQKSTKAAIFLGLATSLKPFIGLFLFYFLIRKEWRALSVFIFTIFICGLIAAAFFGIDIYYPYYQACHQIAWAASSWNVSIYGFLLRLIGGPEANTPLIPLPGLFIFAYPFLSALLIAALIGFLQPLPGIALRKKTDLDFSFTLVAMLLLSPLGWLYYFPFLSIPWLILWNFSKKGIYPIALPLLLATFLLLCNVPIPLIPTNEIKANNVVAVFLGAGLYFSVLVGLIGLLFLLRRPLTEKLGSDFEKIPSKLLLLVCIVAFLPSLLGIAKSTNSWMRYTTKYSSEYTLISHQD
jgi:hypothetical protein